MMAARTNDFLEILNSSGYPLQSKIEEVVSSLGKSSPWSVLLSEYSWANSTRGKEGYVDIVLSHHNVSRLVVESKRLDPAKWVFIVPKEASNGVSRFRLAWSHGFFVGWDDLNVLPKSYEARFCSGFEKQRFTLESIASTLVEAVNFLSVEEGLHQMKDRPNHYVYVPTIVTTAKLFVCPLDHDHVSLETGKLIENPECVEVPYIRFRKTLTTEENDDVKGDIETISILRERSIMVINSACMPEFLSQFHWEADPERGLPWNRQRSFTIERD